MGIRDLVSPVILGNEVLQNGTTLEDADLLAILVDVGQGRDAAVGVDFDKPGLLIFLGQDVDRDKLQGRQRC